MKDRKEEARVDDNEKTRLMAPHEENVMCGQRHLQETETPPLKEKHQNARPKKENAIGDKSWEKNAIKGF